MSRVSGKDLFRKLVREYSQDRFRKLVRELVRRELDEANSTASVGGSYNTPHAFGGSNKKGKGKGKAGYTGGHDDPTDGTGHFIANDPKLRKESVVNEVSDKDVEFYVKKKGLKDASLPFWKVEFFWSPSPSPKYDYIRSETPKGALKVAKQHHKGAKFGKVVFDDDYFLKVNKNLKEGYGVFESINEGRYHAWRNDETLSPKQKIGIAMRETRDNLTELERVVRYNVRLKNEMKVDSRDYWKNTHKALSKISERLVRLANKVGQLH